MTRERKVSIYKPYQKDLIRRELCSIKACIQQKRQKYSWEAFNMDALEGIRDIYRHFPHKMSEDIELDISGKDFQNYDFIKVNDHFRQFAQASINKKTEEPEDLPDEQLICLDHWLTDPNNTYSNLTRKILHGDEVEDFREAVVLANFLHEQALETPTLHAEKFKPKYLSEHTRGLDSGGTRTYSETLTMTVNPHEGHKHVLSVKITGERKLNHSRDMEQFLEDYGIPEEVEQVGWLVISPENNLFAFLREEQRNNNLNYIPVFVNKEAFKNKGHVETIHFVDQPEVYSLPAAQLRDKENNLLNAWAECHRDNQLFFNAK